MPEEPKKRKVTSPETKMLKELKEVNKKLNKVIELLDNIWRERNP